MIQFYSKVEKLCKKKGITITTLVKDLNMSSSSSTNWKNGKIPKADTVIRIAEYFSVSTDFLLTDNTDDKFYPLSKNAMALLEVFHELDEAIQQKVIGRLEFLALESYTDYFKLIEIIKDSGMTSENLIKIIRDNPL